MRTSALFVLLLVAAVAVADAPPAFPTTFYGYMTTTSGTPIGQTLTAAVNGASATFIVANTTLFSCAPFTCNYYIDAARPAGDTSSTLVAFSINSHNIANSTFSSGAVVRLDILDIPGSYLACLKTICSDGSCQATCPGPTPTPSGGGGGSGGSGGSITGAGSMGNETAFDTGNGTVNLTYTRSVRYSAPSNTSTYSLTIVNDGDIGTGPLTIREHIPSNVANNSSSLTFSIQPDWFEQGSVIAVWSLPGGIPAHQSFAVSYSVVKQIYVLSGFGIAFNKTAAPAVQPVQPTQPAANETPMPGSDRDSHGCIPSAGYTWCEAKQKCLRPWEESCEAAKPSQPPAKPAETKKNETAAPQPQQPAQGGLAPAMLLVVGILVAIAVVAGAVYFLAMKGRKKN